MSTHCPVSSSVPVLSVVCNVRLDTAVLDVLQELTKGLICLLPNFFDDVTEHGKQTFQEAWEVVQHVDERH